MTDMEPALAGVVGWPISHSLSPRLHGHWLQRYGIKGHYIPIPLRPQDFEAGISALPKLGFKGVNLTLPYKETILQMATSVTDRASLIGAGNTVQFREGGGLIVDNTDGYGFIQSVKQAVPDWRGDAGPALVLGSGGASRAIIYSLLAEGAPEIRLANRTRQRSEILKDQFGGKVVPIDWNRAADALDESSILVNTTSLGMKGKPEVQLPLASSRPDLIVIDIVYTPGGTGLIRDAQSANRRSVDGIGMLLHQAVPGFESWFGVRPEVDQELQAAVLGS